MGKARVDRPASELKGGDTDQDRDLGTSGDFEEARLPLHTHVWPGGGQRLVSETSLAPDS